MNNLLQADIFFFITSIFVIVLTAGLIFVAYYVIRILRDLKAISELAKKESEKVVAGVEKFAAGLSDAQSAGKIFGWITSFFSGRKRSVGKGKLKE